ncbi:MAG: deaminase [Candidatus Paceibacterota bacterium]|jgi:dCMP deaminase
MKRIKNDANEIIIAFVPVLHEGYRRFFAKYPNVKELFIIGSNIIEQSVPLSKDIRAMSPKMMAECIATMGIFKSIKVISIPELKKLSKSAKIIMPDEDIMHELKDKYFLHANVVFDTIFLRWDKHKSTENKPVEADQTISSKDSDVRIITLLKEESKKSSDWWRRIGAAIVKKNKVILTRHNHTVPVKHLHYVEGDPRSDFHKGVNIELSTVLHAEAGLIADAAREGISLKGAEMYVTTFPCPPCAKLIAYSGIKKLYYSDGYGVLDGERVLKSSGVKIIFVKTD